MSELIETPYGTIKIKPCRCGNKYPTLECTTINSKYSLYFFYCKNCEYIADVSFSKKKLSNHGTREATINKKSEELKNA